MAVTAKSIHVSKAMIRHCLALAVLAVLAGQVVGQTMQHEAAVKSAQFSLGRPAVVTASKDYTARLWDAATVNVICFGVWLLASASFVSSFS